MHCSSGFLRSPEAAAWYLAGKVFHGRRCQGFQFSCSGAWFSLSLLDAGFHLKRLSQKSDPDDLFPTLTWLAVQSDLGIDTCGSQVGNRIRWVEKLNCPSFFWPSKQF